MCEVCANACVAEDGMAACVRACRDCADLGALAVRFMARHAVLSPELCEVTAKACEVCAEECERYDDDVTRACAEACRRCAEACNVIAA